MRAKLFSVSGRLLEDLPAPEARCGTAGMSFYIALEHIFRASTWAADYGLMIETPRKGWSHASPGQSNTD